MMIDDNLTIARNFNSKIQKVINEREKRANENKEVSKYEGIVPVHQRLVLLV